jgi:hypothetical protein
LSSNDLEMLSMNDVDLSEDSEESDIAELAAQELSRRGFFGRGSHRSGRRAHRT